MYLNNNTGVYKQKQNDSARHASSNVYSMQPSVEIRSSSPRRGGYDKTSSSVSTEKPRYAYPTSREQSFTKKGAGKPYDQTQEYKDLIDAHERLIKEGTLDVQYSNGVPKIPDEFEISPRWGSSSSRFMQCLIGFLAVGNIFRMAQMLESKADNGHGTYSKGDSFDQENAKSSKANSEKTETQKNKPLQHPPTNTPKNTNTESTFTKTIPGTIDLQSQKSTNNKLRVRKEAKAERNKSRSSETIASHFQKDLKDRVIIATEEEAEEEDVFVDALENIVNTEKRSFSGGAAGLPEEEEDGVTIETEEVEEEDVWVETSESMEEIGEKRSSLGETFKFPGASADQTEYRTMPPNVEAEKFIAEQNGKSTNPAQPTDIPEEINFQFGGFHPRDRRRVGPQAPFEGATVVEELTNWAIPGLGAVEENAIVPFTETVPSSGGNEINLRIPNENNLWTPVSYYHPSGFQINIYPDPTAKSANVVFNIRSGSNINIEPYVAYSVAHPAHFVEHILFRWAFLNLDEYKQLDVGGTVFPDHTHYEADVMSNNVPLAVDVLAKMLFHSKINLQQLAIERNVILIESLWGRKNISNMLYDVSLNDLLKYYIKYYRPYNAELNIVGYANPSEIIQQINSLFTNVFDIKHELHAELYPRLIIEEIDSLYDNSANKSTIEFGWKYPYKNSPNTAVMDILMDLIESKIDQFIPNISMIFTDNSITFQFETDVNKRKQDVDSIIEQFANIGFWATESDLQAIKSRLLKEAVKKLDALRANSKSTKIAIEQMKMYIRQLRAICLKDIETAAQSNFRKDKAIIKEQNPKGTAAREGSERPNFYLNPDWREMLSSRTHPSEWKYTTAAQINEGMTIHASHCSEDSFPLEFQSTINNHQSFRLPNDFHVLLWPNKKTPFVTVQGGFRLKRSDVNYDSLDDIISNEIISKRLESINAKLSWNFDLQGEFIFKIECSPQDIVKVIDLVDIIVKGPDIPKNDELTKFRKQNLMSNNGIIAIVGDFGTNNPNLVYAELTNKFQDLPRGESYIPTPISTRVPRAASLGVLQPAWHIDKQGEAALLSVFTAPLSEKISYNIMMERIIKHIIYDKLFQDIRHKEGLLYGLSVDMTPYGELKISLTTNSDADKINRVTRIIQNTLGQLFSGNDLTPDQVKAAQQKCLNEVATDNDRLYENMSALASNYVKDYLRGFNSSDYARYEQKFKQQVNDIEAITPEHVQQVLKKLQVPVINNNFLREVHRMFPRH